jgi:hypothetical protein
MIGAPPSFQQATQTSLRRLSPSLDLILKEEFISLLKLRHSRCRPLHVREFGPLSVKKQRRHTSCSIQMSYLILIGLLMECVIPTSQRLTLRALLWKQTVRDAP